MKKLFKQLCKENIRIQIKDFELKDVSFYGCDADFDIEIKDKETGILLATDNVRVENAFWGVDDSEEFYYFLEGKEIDFSEEYDDDFDNLPSDLLKEFEDYELDYYNNAYHELLFEGEESLMDCYIDKIMHQLDPGKDKFYFVHGKKIAWINITADYKGFHLHSDDVEIKKVYNVYEERWIYEMEGVFFSITGNSDNLIIHRYKRDKTYNLIMTAEDFDNNRCPDYWGKIGDVLYGYNKIRNKHQ